MIDIVKEWKSAFSLHLGDIVEKALRYFYVYRVSDTLCAAIGLVDTWKISMPDDLF